MLVARSIVAICCAASFCAAQETAGLETLDNGVLRVGLSRDHGGSLAYLSRSGEDDNLINVHDLGRYVQQSYYSGPKPFLPDELAVTLRALLGAARE